MKIISAVCALIISVLVVSGCAAKPGIYGNPLTETKVTTVADISANADSLSGKVVRLEGQIVRECPAGGWIMLKDNTGTIYVDLHPNQIAIPQAVGHSVAAQGKVRKDGKLISVLGEGVELK